LKELVEQATCKKHIAVRARYRLLEGIFYLVSKLEVSRIKSGSGRENKKIKVAGGNYV
jgi:hypothetical protein